MGGLLHICSRNMCIVNGVAEVRHSQHIIQGGGNNIPLGTRLYMNFFALYGYYVKEREWNNIGWQNVLRYHSYVLKLSRYEKNLYYN